MEVDFIKVTPQEMMSVKTREEPVVVYFW